MQFQFAGLASQHELVKRNVIFIRKLHRRLHVVNCCREKEKCHGKKVHKTTPSSTLTVLKVNKFNNE